LATLASVDPSRRDWRLTAAPFVLALIPLLYLIWLAIRLSVDVPFGDQWELIPNLNKLDAGTLSFHDVWQLRNEHRPLFPTLVMLGLAWITKWNINVEIALNLLLGVAVAVVYLSTLRSRDQPGPAWRWWAVPVLSPLLFSPAQWENWLWGQQLLMFMNVLGVAIGFRFLSGPGRSTRRFIGAIACGVFGMYCFGTGLTYWPVALLAFALNDDQKSWRRVVVWITVASLAIATYAIDFYRPPGSVPLLSNLTNPRVVADLAVYMCKFVGAPVAGYDGKAAAVAGIVGVTLMATLVVVTFRLRRTRLFLFACLIGVNAIADGLLTGVGRAAYGADSSLASRYQTIAAPFWVAVVLLSVLAITQIGARERWSRAWLAVPIALACALCLSVAKNGSFGLIGATARSNMLRSLRPHLQAGTNWKAVSRLYLDDERSVKERAGVLRRLGMSVYRDQGTQGSGVLDPTNELPIGTVDTPSEGAIVPMSTLAGGWAVDDRGIREIRLYVDGHFMSTTPLNTPRADVARIYPQYARGTDMFGWTTTIDFPAAGPHTIVAQAVDSDGATHDLATVKVRVVDQSR
jgi:hypothetical protein